MVAKILMLERKHIVHLGPQEREFDGQLTRDVELQPCGCWAGRVWREVTFAGTTTREWCTETRQCSTHSAVVILAQWEIARRLAGEGRLLVGQRGNAPPQRLSEDAFFAQLGDGAKRLWVDRLNVLAKAKELDEELRALGVLEHKWLTAGEKP
jgi:hypothetical protein